MERPQGVVQPHGDGNLAADDVQLGTRRLFDGDRHAVEAFEPRDDLSEVMPRQVEYALRPEVVVGVLDAPQGEAVAAEADEIVRVHHDLVVPGELVRYAEPAPQQGRGEFAGGFVGRDVEFRSQHLDVAGEGLHDERARRVVVHVEHRFAGEFHPPGLAEPQRVFQPCPGVQADGRAVLQRDVHALSRGGGNREILVGRLLDDDAPGGVPRSREQQQGGSGLHAAAHGRQAEPLQTCGGHRPAGGTGCVDEGGIVDEPQGVQLLLVFGIGPQPIHDGLLLRFRGPAVDVFVQQFFFHTSIRCVGAADGHGKRADRAK